MAYGAALGARERQDVDVSSATREMWDRLIREHDRKVVLSLLAIGIDRERARELAQATWTRLIEQHREGKLAGLELPGLAIRQARFLAIDSMRNSDLHRRTVAMASGGDEHDVALDGERQLLSRDQLRRALETLATCSSTAQQLFKMMYADQPARSCIEAARELGLSAERARHVICETRKLIRLAMEEST